LLSQSLVIAVNEDKSRRYHRLRRRAAVLSAVLAAGLLAFLVASGASVWLRDVAAALSHRGFAHPLTVAAYVVILVLLHDAVMFPLALYRGFVLEQRYGLSSETLRAWAVDHAKAAAVSLVFALLGGQIVYASLVSWPRLWWLTSALVFIAGMIILARMAPIVLMPLFYRFRPLERDALRERLVTLSGRAGVPVLGVYEWGLGDKTRRANAALVGTGGTRRVLLSDTLLAEYSDDEIEVILAHELGHHAHGDIAKGIAIEAALIIGGFAVAAIVLARYWNDVGLTSPADVAGLPLLVLIAGCLGLVSAPLLNALSRRNERRADRYALTMTERPAAFVSAMKRLAAQNLAEPSPSRTAVWLFHTHPPIEQRIEAARRFEHARP
jgi:STE24 endopeptidase